MSHDSDWEKRHKDNEHAFFVVFCNHTSILQHICGYNATLMNFVAHDKLISLCGHFDRLVQQLSEEDILCALDCAISEGKLDMVQFFYRAGYGLTHPAVRVAARNGHYDIVDWLLEMVYPMSPSVCTEKAVNDAIARGYITIASLIREKTRFSYNDDVMKCIGKYGSVDGLMYIIEAEGFARFVDPITYSDFQDLQRRGLFEVVSRATVHNNVHILRHLHNVGLLFLDQWRDDIVEIAISRGRVDILDFIEDEVDEFVLPFSSALTDAANGGHLDLLKWMNARGKLLTKEISRLYAVVTKKNDTATCKWLLENRPEPPDLYTEGEAIQRALNEKKYEIAQLLFDSGSGVFNEVSITQVLTAATKNHEILHPTLSLSTCPCNDYYGELFEWLRKNKAENDRRQSSIVHQTTQALRRERAYRNNSYNGRIAGSLLILIGAFLFIASLV